MLRKMPRTTTAITAIQSPSSQRPISFIKASLLPIIVGAASRRANGDRQCVAQGTCVSVRVDLGGRRFIQKPKRYMTSTLTVITMTIRSDDSTRRILEKDQEHI